jgi:hypothetical protein
MNSRHLRCEVHLTAEVELTDLRRQGKHRQRKEVSSATISRFLLLKIERQLTALKTRLVCFLIETNLSKLSVGVEVPNSASLCA